MKPEYESKVKYLKGYSIFFAKIKRIKEMCIYFPEKANELDKETAVCWEAIEKIEKQIKAVDNGLLSEILFQKYVLGRSLEAVSCELNYSKRQIERLHLVALEKLKIS